jgi:hypothetical protein
MVNRTILVRRSFTLLLIAVLVAIIPGCGSVNHKLSLLDTYAPEPSTKIEVGRVTNETGKTFDIATEQMLADAFAEVLRKEKLLWVGGEDHKLVLTTRIVEYEKGSAFQRWLLPGWGSTVVSIQGDLRHADQVVGSFQARRTVSIGGGYTIGAWRTIFASVAKDVVNDLRSKIPK